MSFLSLAGVELRKTRRSGILWILVIPVFLIWLTAVINADINFTIGNEGISPENNFFIQSFMGYAWFMFPASIVISTVMLVQTEDAGSACICGPPLPGEIFYPSFAGSSADVFYDPGIFSKCGDRIPNPGL